MSVFGIGSSKLVRASLSLLIAALAAPAATIEYVATDLVDVNPGQDLWRYDYTVGGRAFAQSEFFDIHFAPSLYTALAAGPAPNTDWDAIILQQPEPANLPPFDRGMFDALALVDSPSLSGTFSVSFIYLGTGEPGAQVFEIYDFTGSVLAESGVTAPLGVVIPEPSTAALFLIGLGAGAIRLCSRSGVNRRSTRT